MWLHLVQACARYAKRISPPTVDLSRSCAPKDLVEHDIGLIDIDKL